MKRIKGILILVLGILLSFSIIAYAIESPEMVTIQAGTAADGNTEITNDIEMSKYEVTQEEFHSLMGFNPSHFSGNNLPVEKVTWYDAVMYCNKLSEAEGLDKYYSISEINYEGTEGKSRIKYATIRENNNANGYRLPISNEWEYAARGGANGNATAYAGSDNIDDVAWYDNNSGDKTHPVGEKKANELGIYDMSGNVLEWVHELPKQYGYNYSQGLRGGSWDNNTDYCVVDAGEDVYPAIRMNIIGFRITRTK